MQSMTSPCYIFCKLVQKPVCACERKQFLLFLHLCSGLFENYTVVKFKDHSMEAVSRCGVFPLDLRGASVVLSLDVWLHCQ